MEGDKAQGSGLRERAPCRGRSGEGATGGGRGLLLRRRVLLLGGELLQTAMAASLRPPLRWSRLRGAVAGIETATLLQPPPAFETPLVPRTQPPEEAPESAAREPAYAAMGFVGGISEKTLAQRGRGTARAELGLSTMDYLRAILTSQVYDVAVESPLELAEKLSERTGNRILLKREDLQQVPHWPSNHGVRLWHNVNVAFTSALLSEKKHISD